MMLTTGTQSKAQKMSSGVEAALTVDTADLDELIYSIPTLSAFLMNGEAQLKYQNGRLKVIVFGGAFELPCEGEWAHVVRIPLRLLCGLKGRLPDSLNLRLFVKDSWLYIGSLKISCQVQEQSLELVDLSVEAGLLDILSLSQTLTPEQSLQAGLSGAITAASKKVDDALQKAWPFLSSLGVPKEVFVRSILDFSAAAKSQK